MSKSSFIQTIRHIDMLLVQGPVKYTSSHTGQVKRCISISIYKPNHTYIKIVAITTTMSLMPQLMQVNIDSQGHHN